jgi:hypothetical protein
MSLIRKIPLNTLISILENIYNSGANYVDIQGETDDSGVPQDTIIFSVRPEYMCDDEEEDNDDECKIKTLSDEELNELI